MIENFRYNYNWLKIFVGFSPELSLSSRVQWRKMFGCWSVNSGLMLRNKKKGLFVPLYSIKKYVYLHYLALEILILLSLPFLSVQLANQTRIWADFRRRFLSVLATPKDSKRLEKIQKDGREFWQWWNLYFWPKQKKIPFSQVSARNIICYYCSVFPEALITHL